MNCLLTYQTRNYALLLALLGAVFPQGGQFSGIISKIEKSLFSYCKKGTVLPWRWNCPASVCEESRPIRFKLSKWKFKNMDVTLESVECKRIETEVLSCAYEREGRPPEEEHDKIFHIQLYFINGLNGELYELSFPWHKTRCMDPQTLVTKRCLRDHPENFAEVEKSFYNNYDVIYQRKWISTKFVCDLVRPAGFDYSYAFLASGNLMLQHRNNQLVPVKILKCFFGKHVSNVSGPFRYTEALNYVRNTSGEVYELSYVYENGSADYPIPHTYTILKLAINNIGRLAHPLCSEESTKSSRILRSSTINSSNAESSSINSCVVNQDM